MKVYAGRLNGRALPLASFLDPSTDPPPRYIQAAVGGGPAAPSVIDPEATRLHGQTFFEAAGAANFHVTLAFLLAGVDPDARESGGRAATAMHYAAASGEGAVVQLLADNGANVNSTTPSGQTPLMWAAERGHGDVAKQLLTLGADPLAVDEEGHGVAFHGAFSPLTLHIFVRKNLLDVAQAVDRAHQTPLHVVCQKSGTRIPVLYFVETAGADPNATDNRGKTPLHYACATGDVETVLALASRGARWDIADGNGFTPLNQPQTSRKVRRAIERFAAETNNTARERMARPDASNWSQLTLEQCKHAAVPFFVPNVIILVGTLLPTVLALLVAAIAGGGFAMVAQFGMRQKKRSLATAGWFAGALTFGSAVLFKKVIPTFQQTHESTSIPHLWGAATLLMFFFYLRAVFADPGAVHGSPEERRKIYDSVADCGESEVQRVGYDTTTMVVKPLRAKHCTKTHFTIYRFDHFCVWTGNAIGGGNHRFFVLYALFQVIAQLCVTIMTISFLFYAAPSLQPEPVKMHNWCFLCNWLFNSENTIVTIFLLLYNMFVFLFVATVCFTQLWYATRNVTSNEVWFADRYKWMFKLGSRAYSLYDRGALLNLFGFFWKDNLCADLHTVPAMNDHLIKICRRHTSKMKSLAPQPPQVPQQPQYAQAAASTSPAAQGSSASPLGLTNVAYPSNPSSSPLVPQDFNLEHAVQRLPEDKQNEMALVQGMLQQLIAGQDPTPPTALSEERQSHMLHKAKTMFEHYKKAMAMQTQLANFQRVSQQLPAQQHQQQQQQQQQAKPVSPATSAVGTGAPSALSFTGNGGGAAPQQQPGQPPASSSMKPKKGD